jgi:hypothetical protein
LLVTGKGVPDGSGGNIPNLGTVSIRFDRSPTGGGNSPGSAYPLHRLPGIFHRD